MASEQDGFVRRNCAGDAALAEEVLSLLDAERRAGAFLSQPAIEVAASYIDIGKAFVPLLVVCMVAKFAIVAGYFMHLKFDNTLLTRVFVAGILLAIGVYLAFLTSLQIF